MHVCTDGGQGVKNGGDGLVGLVGAVVIFEGRCEHAFQLLPQT